MGASGLKVHLRRARNPHILTPIAGRHPSIPAPSKGTSLGLYPRPKPCHLYGTQNPLPFSRYARHAPTHSLHSHAHAPCIVEQVPVDDFQLPLGKAEILIPGSDLTLLTWGTPVYNSENAIHILQNPPPALEKLVPASLRSAKIELIDLRSILPWDVETVVESVRRTGRLVIVHEAGMTAGVGAEISAEVQKRCFLKLNAPVKRVTGWECVSFLSPCNCCLLITRR